MKAILQFLSKASSIYLILFFIFLAVPLSAQDDEEYYDDDEYYDEYEDIEYFPTNAVLLMAGYGDEGGLMLGLGWRWTNFSAQLCLSGFTNDMPIPSPIKQGTLSSDTAFYTDLIMSFDLGYHYNFGQYTAFATLGYYSQSDSAFTQTLDGREFFRERGRTESGLAFGLGLNYAFNEGFGLGLAYHNQHGIYLQAAIRIGKD